jgi:tripartite-type tricarboxylate transporter receptor subunit TctC
VCLIFKMIARRQMRSYGNLSGGSIAGAIKYHLSGDARSTVQAVAPLRTGGSMDWRARTGFALFILAGNIVGAGTTAAQSYPNKPIRLIVPFPPGGINDTVARPLAEGMKSALGAIVIENPAGAGGVLGASAVARSVADGYTMLLGSAGTHVVGPLAVAAPPYDPLKDFRSVGILAVTGLAIVVHPSLPVKNLKEFVAYAGAPSRPLSYASAGIGSATHLGGELFKSLVRTPGIAHVPYKGGAPALADLLGGHVPVGVLNINGPLFDFHRTGKIRVLAVTTANRSTLAPDIVAARESIPGMVAINFFGLFVPAATPEPILEKLVAAMQTAMADKPVLELWNKAGLEVSTDNTPDKGQRFVEGEITRWSPVIKSLGLKLD